MQALIRIMVRSRTENIMDDNGIGRAYRLRNPWITKMTTHDMTRWDIFMLNPINLFALPLDIQWVYINTVLYWFAVYVWYAGDIHMSFRNVCVYSFTFY